MFKLYSLLFSVCILKAALALNATEYEEAILELSEDPEFLTQFALNLRDNFEIEPNYLNYTPFNKPDYKFECEKDSDPTVATSVHRLRPQDIKVVGALGDSLTAA